MNKSRMNRILHAGLACSAVIWLFCSYGVAGSVDDLRHTPASAVAPSDQPDVDRGVDYRIGRQDLLEIRVFELDELSQTVRVGGDGFISLPLLGRVRADGLTKTGLERLIAERLDGRYVLDPQVTVFVQEAESTKVAVNGAVKAPGRYAMLGPMTLLDMISQAGGLQENHGGEIVVLRVQPDGSTRRMPIDLQRLVAADPESNLTLEPGDVVYVAEQESIRIFVGGAVNNPNMFEIPNSGALTVMQAITLAGGTTPRAAEKKVQIIRTDPTGRRDTLIVDYRKVKRGKAEDPVLQANDVVFVQQSFF